MVDQILSDMTDRRDDRSQGHDHAKPDLHAAPPMTMRDLQSGMRWIVPVAGGAFLVLAVLAALDALPWDRPITEWIAERRTTGLNDFWRSMTELGGERVVRVVALCCAVLAWPRCRPLAIAIVVLALDAVAAGLLVEGNRGSRSPAGIPRHHLSRWALVPERSPVRGRRELGVHSSRHRALHQATLGLVDLRVRRLVARRRDRRKPRVSRCPLHDRRHCHPSSRSGLRRRRRAPHRIPAPPPRPVAACLWRFAAAGAVSGRQPTSF